MWKVNCSMYSLLIIVFAMMLIIIISTLLMIKFLRLGNIEINYDRDEILNKFIENSEVPMPVIRFTDGIFKSSYLLEKRTVLVGKTKTSALSIIDLYVTIHECAHYVQHVKYRKKFDVFKKYYILQFLKIISILGLHFLVMYVTKNFKKIDDHKFIFLSLALISMMMLSVIYEIWVAFKIEYDANQMVRSFWEREKIHEYARIKNLPYIILVASLSKIIIYIISFTLIYIVFMQ